MFLIDHYAGDIGNENIAGKYLKKILYQCHPPYARPVSSYGVLDYNSLLHIIYVLFIYM